MYKFTDGKLHTTLYTKPTDRVLTTQQILSPHLQTKYRLQPSIDDQKNLFQTIWVRKAHHNIVEKNGL